MTKILSSSWTFSNSMFVKSFQKLQKFSISKFVPKCSKTMATQNSIPPIKRWHPIPKPLSRPPQFIITLIKIKISIYIETSGHLSRCWVRMITFRNWKRGGNKIVWHCFEWLSVKWARDCCFCEMLITAGLLHAEMFLVEIFRCASGNIRLMKSSQSSRDSWADVYGLLLKVSTNLFELIELLIELSTHLIWALIEYEFFCSCREFRVGKYFPEKRMKIEWNWIELSRCQIDFFP